MRINRVKLAPDDFLTWIGRREFTTADLCNRCGLDTHDAEFVIRSFVHRRLIVSRAKRGNRCISLFAVREPGAAE